MKNSFKLKILAAAVLMASGGVNAAPTVNGTWGDHDPFEFGFFATAGNIVFDHIYTFTLPAALLPYQAVTAAVTNDSSPVNVFDISNGTLSLFADNGDSDYTNDALVGSFAFDNTSITGVFSPLAAGNYFYEVTGDVTGTVGGSYTLSSTVSLVPEPETYAMLLTGLGLIGFSARRRMQG